MLRFIRKFSLALVLSGIGSSAMAQQSDQQFSLKLGEIFSIELPGKAGTGASWALTQLPAQASLLGIEQLEDQHCHKPLVGCGTKVRYRFKAIHRGVGDVQLSYARPWLDSVWTTKTFSVTVN